MKDDFAMDREAAKGNSFFGVTASEWAQCIGGLWLLFSLLNFAALLLAVAALFLALGCVVSAFYVNKSGNTAATSESEGA